jgi:hypothetical protein
MAKYQQVNCHFPLAIPRGPRTELVSKYEELCLDITPPPPVREHPANRWISDKTWVAVDKQATMHRKGHQTTAITCWMGHEIKSLLTAARKQRAANTASTVESHLSNGAMKEAWRALKGWYRLTEDQPPPACPRPWSDRWPSMWNCMQGPPPWGKPSRLTSCILRLPTTCPQTQSYKRW